MKILAKTTAGLAGAALLAGAAASLSAESTDMAEIPAQDAFVPIERYGISYDKPRDIAEFYLKQFGLHRNDADLHEIRHPSDRTMRILFVTVDGIENNVVTDVQWRLGVKVSEGQWQAVEAGIRRKCLRGENPGQWTKGVCP